MTAVRHVSKIAGETDHPGLTTVAATAGAEVVAVDAAALAVAEKASEAAGKTSAVEGSVTVVGVLVPGEEEDLEDPATDRGTTRGTGRGSAIEMLRLISAGVRLMNVTALPLLGALHLLAVARPPRVLQGGAALRPSLHHAAGVHLPRRHLVAAYARRPGPLPALVEIAVTVGLPLVRRARLLRLVVVSVVIAVHLGGAVPLVTTTLAMIAGLRHLIGEGVLRPREEAIEPARLPTELRSAMSTLLVLVAPRLTAGSACPGGMPMRMMSGSLRNHAVTVLPFLL